MRRSHLDDKVLAVYVTEPDTLANRDEVEDHLRACEQCGEIVAEARSFEEALENPESWAAQTLAGLPRTLPDDLDYAVSTFSIGDATADYLLEPLLRSRETFQAARVGEDAMFRSCAAVRRLIRASEEAREQHPRDSLMFADTAVIIVEQLSTMQYSFDEIETVRGQAWRERANALRYCGNYVSALAAVDLADAAFGRARVTAFDIARNDFIRGTILWKMERFAEALPLAQRSRRNFLAFGDTERWVHAGLLEGGILFDSHAYSKALEVFEGLREPAEKVDLGPTLGLVYNGLAAALQELDQLPRAAELFQKALALYDHFGMELERTRTMWSLALLAIRHGQRADGMARLRVAVDAFMARASVTDAGLVALDLAERLLEDGSAEEVLLLCERLAVRFAASGMTARADAAMRFVQESMQRGRVPLPAIQHARGYFRRLVCQPELLFLAPTESAS